MLTKIVTLAVAALALVAPPAAADHATYDCGFDTIAQETLTGGADTFTGVAYGYIVSPTPEEAASIRCYVTVDGVEVPTAGTDTGAGTMAAVTHGQITYTVGETQVVELCAEWTAGAESGTSCQETERTQIPPQEVIDLIEYLICCWTGPPDWQSLCWWLPLLSPGVPGVVDIDSEGDVAIAGEPFWDCPPYEV